ncbi:MAG: hypothetical protein WC682_00530 [Parcubacteria group bacterium]|jgi:hypothetical protein
MSKKRRPFFTPFGKKVVATIFVATLVTCLVGTLAIFVRVHQQASLFQKDGYYIAVDNGNVRDGLPILKKVPFPKK